MGVPSSQGGNTSLQSTSCKGGSRKFTIQFCKKGSDCCNFPSIYATVLDILLSCPSRITIIYWQKFTFLAFHKCGIMPNAVFFHVMVCEGGRRYVQFFFLITIQKSGLSLEISLKYVDYNVNDSEHHHLLPPTIYARIQMLRILNSDA